MRPSSRPSALTVISPSRAASSRLTSRISCSSLFFDGAGAACDGRTFVVDLSWGSPANAAEKPRVAVTPIISDARMQ